MPSQIDPLDELFDERDPEEDCSASCKTCGATGLYWVQGEKWMLYDSRTDERHACIVIRRRDDTCRP